MAGLRRGALRQAARHAAGLLRRAPHRRAHQPADHRHRPAAGRAEPPDRGVLPADPGAGRRHRAAHADAAPAHAHRAGVVPLVVGSALFFGRRLRRITTGVQDKVADATAVAEEAFSQIRTVQSFVQEPAERGALRRADRRACRSGAGPGAGARRVLRGAHLHHLRRHRRRALAGRAAGARRHSSPPGALVQLPALHHHHRGRRSGRWPRSSAATRRRSARRSGCSSSSRCEPPIADPAAPAPLPKPVRGRGRVRRRVASGTSDDPTPPWTLRRGQPHGARRARWWRWWARPAPGKTTLVSLLPRFWDVDRGPDPARRRSTSATLRLADLRGAIGIVPQEPALFSGTVRENIAYARPGGLRGRRGGGGPRGARPRVHRAAARGLRHRGGRAGGQALGRPAAADRDRPGHSQGPGGADPRRGHQQPRHRERAADRGRAGASCWWAAPR